MSDEPRYAWLTSAYKAKVRVRFLGEKIEGYGEIRDQYGQRHVPIDALEFDTPTLDDDVDDLL